MQQPFQILFSVVINNQGIILITPLLHVCQLSKEVHLGFENVVVVVVVVAAHVKSVTANSDAASESRPFSPSEKASAASTHPSRFVCPTVAADTNNNTTSVANSSHKQKAKFSLQKSQTVIKF